MKIGPILCSLSFLMLGSLSATTTLFSDLGQANSTTQQVFEPPYKFANDFLTNGSDASVTGAVFLMSNADTIDHTFTASIYTDSSGTPGTLVGSFDPFTILAGTNSLANFTTTSTGINLSANTPYWTVLQMNQAQASTYPRWGIDHTDSVDGSSLYTNITNTPAEFFPGSGWLPIFGDDSFNFQYSLSGDLAPEPSRAMLMIAGVCVLGLRRRR